MSKQTVNPKLAPVPQRYTCIYCGRPLSATEKTKDHFIPTAHGGTDDPSNIVIACGRCNKLKADSVFDDLASARAYLIELYKIREQIRKVRAKFVRKPNKSIELLPQLLKHAADDERRDEIRYMERLQNEHIGTTVERMAGSRFIDLLGEGSHNRKLCRARRNRRRLRKRGWRLHS